MAELPFARRPAPHVVRRIHRARVEANAKRDAMHGGKRLALSQVGKCERNLWASIHDVPEDSPVEPRVLELFALGNTIEDHLVRALRDAGYGVEDRDPATGQQFRIVMCGARASGRTDGIVTIPSDGRRVLLEIKSASAKQYDLLEAAESFLAWNPVYYDQVQIYLGELRLDECLVLVYCKNDSRIWSEYVRLDIQRHRELVQKVERIVSAEAMPDRPAEATARGSKFCQWCPRAEWCWSPVREASFDE